MRTRIILLITAILSFFTMGCKSSNDIKQEITNRLTAIYADALTNIIPDEDEEVPEKDLIALYCTEEFKNLWNQTAEEEANSGYICLDYDVWTNAQDADKPTMRIESIEILDNKHAKANIVINDFGTDSTNQLILVKEKNEWRIDDFIREDFSVKNEMIEFLKEE